MSAMVKSVDVSQQSAHTGDNGRKHGSWPCQHRFQEEQGGDRRRKFGRSNGKETNGGDVLRPREIGLKTGARFSSLKVGESHRCGLRFRWLP